MSSVWKNRLSLTVFGQSHGKAIGMCLDGVPSGHKIDMDALQLFLKRRAPGGKAWATPRKEGDLVEFVSGFVGNVTCGAPITGIIYNTNTRSGDYKEVLDIPRPGHADYTAQIKYNGHQDISGGGHFSGRITAGLCMAGGIAIQLLKARGISVFAHIKEIGGVAEKSFSPENFDVETIEKLQTSDFSVLDDSCGEAMKVAIAEAKADLDSVGGIVECAVLNLPAGLGEPMFDGMENRIASLLFAIPAVKGVEFGAGFKVARLRGSQNNDPFVMVNGKVKTKSNNHGGILGGITSGMPLICRMAVKPTPSIPREQESISFSTGKNSILAVKGRHDPCIVPRAVPCMEAAIALCVYDALLEWEGIKS